MRKRIALPLAIAVLALLSILFFSAKLFCPAFYPGHMATSSPTGEYMIEQRWTDFCTIGYRGKMYLWVDGKRYEVNNLSPTTVRWLDDTTFEVASVGALGWGVYGISDFVGRT